MVSTADKQKTYQIRGFYNASMRKLAFPLKAFDFAEAQRKANDYGKVRNATITDIVLWEPKRKLV